MRTVLAVMALILVGCVATASAQRARAPASRPEVIQRNQEIFRAPPRSPAARPDRLPPSEIGRPRERIEPLPEMKPRVGN
jgi:hypothetical protein